MGNAKKRRTVLVPWVVNAMKFLDTKLQEDEFDNGENSNYNDNAKD